MTESEREIRLRNELRLYAVALATAYLKVHMGVGWATADKYIHNKWGEFTPEPDVGEFWYSLADIMLNDIPPVIESRVSKTEKK